MRNRLFPIFVALVALIVAGCATDREPSNRNIAATPPLLSATNLVPGSTYEVRIYIITKGDTASIIARKFGISIMELRAMNPDLDPKRLKIYQKVKVFEKLTP